ncbi:MAG: hypothetical protein E7478_03280 [Ruminococcaceae bacterium]|nr:hypothetical protein [Oscillospiraceae bacterium]
MKKFLSVVLAAFVLFSLGGCGKHEDSTEDNDDTAHDIVTLDASSTTQIGTEQADNGGSMVMAGSEGSASQQGSGDTADSKMQEVAIPEEKRILGKGKLYANYWCLSVEGMDYLYNITDGTLRESQWIDLENVSGSTYYDTSTKRLVDIATGKEICQLDEETFLIPCENKESRYFPDGKALAFKIEKGFSGDTYYMGYLNVNGEWDVPMTTEFPALKCDGADKIKDKLSDWYGDQANIGTFTYFDGMYGVQLGDYYFFDENAAYSMSSSYGEYTDYLTACAGKCSDGIIYGYIRPNNGEATDLFIYDCDTQEYDITSLTDVGISTVMNRIDINFYDEYIGIYYYVYSGASNQDYNYIKLDYDFNVIEQYDMTQCSDIEQFEASDKAVAFFGANKSGDHYLCLMNPDGSFAFDPIKTEDRLLIEGIELHINNDMFICYHSKADKTYIYSFVTNQLTVFDSVSGKRVVNHDPVSGMIVVHDQNANDGLGNYYLADSAAPNDLIVPFEA